MSDFSIGFEYGKTHVEFELHEESGAQGEKVTIGDKEYSLKLVKGSKQQYGKLIDEIFSQAASNSEVKSPKDLTSIIATLQYGTKKLSPKNVTITELRTVEPIHKDTKAGGIASKIANFFLGALNAIIFPFKAIGYTTKYAITRLFTPAPKSLVRDRLDELEEKLGPKRSTYTDVSGIKKDEEELKSYGFKLGDWKKLKSEKPTLTLHANSKTKFTQTEYDALKTLEKDPKTFTAEEKETLKRFLAHISGNSDFNARISQFLNESKEVSDYTIQLEHLRELSFKTGKLEQLARLAPKVALVAEKVDVHSKKEHTLSDDERLTLTDFRQADSFVNMLDQVDDNNQKVQGSLPWLEGLQLWPQVDMPSLFSDMKKHVASLDKSIKTINERYKAEAEYDTGDIVLDDMKATKKYDSRAFDITNIFDWMADAQSSILRQRFCHAGMGIKTPAGTQFNIVQMYYRFTKTRASSSRLCISRLFAPDFNKLLSDSAKKALQAKYPTNWQEKVLEKYQQCVRDFYKDKRVFDHYRNDVRKMCSAPFIGHTQSEAVKPNELKPQKAVSDDTIEQIFCSEFTARSLCWCINRLGDALKKELQLQGDVSTVIKNPIPEYEKFEALHPDRLYELIEEYTVERPKPDFVKAILK
jgi:hypothetical protein